MEELWTLSRTALSIVTWRHSIEDPVREWGQLLAYLPEIRRIMMQHGPSIVFLPSPRLDGGNLAKDSDQLGKLATELSLVQQEVRAQARAAIAAELGWRGDAQRFANILDH